MIILSIETSCDETAISIVEARGGIKSARFRILANNVASQIKIHRKYGGVYPMLAKREHLKNLPILFKKTLKEAGLSEKKIDIVAVTYGPGLEPALWTGLEFAKALAKKLKKKLIPVNHMEGHIFSSLLKEKKKYDQLKVKSLKLKEFETLRKVGFPALALLISGGHTELVLVKKFMNYKILGETRDDAAGEAFDKVARLLGLPYPGGPEISKLAKLNPPHPALSLVRRGKIQISLPRPMINSGDFDFSFSGLKTAVLYLVRDLEKKYKFKISAQGGPASGGKMAIAKEFQDAVTDVLVSKTMRSAKEFKVKTIITGGGVIANDQIRKTLQKEVEKLNIPIYFPTKELSVDNSIMIALAGYFRYITKSAPSKSHSIAACGGLRLE